jgi:hypothetical protein
LLNTSIMKTKSLKTISTVVASVFVLSTTLYAQGIDSRIGHAVIEATAITKADAEKKYPPPAGGYPTGQRDPHDPSGLVSSPYPPHQKYDCSKKVAHGGLVLDVKVNKVFVRP